MIIEKPHFNCQKCGLCCMCLKKNPIAIELNMIDKDGCCRWLDKETKLCTIYDHRPLPCSVDRLYDETEIKDKMTRGEWYKLNYEACKKLQQDYDKVQGKEG